MTTNNIARLNADNSLDTTFATNASANGPVTGFAVQANTQIVLIGTFTILDGVSRAGIARLNSDGTLDKGFNPTPSGGLVSAIALQGDGKILIGGTFTELQPNRRDEPHPHDRRPGPAQQPRDGSLDPSLPNLSPDAPIDAILEQSNGEFVIGGQFTGVLTAGASTLTVRGHVARSPTRTASWTPASIPRPMARSSPWQSKPTARSS